MATRRRIGVSTATTEAARRQLMQPVPCWEKVWVVAENAGTSFKIRKWVKTDKIQASLFLIPELVFIEYWIIQQFSDEEGEVDEPLAPLPDEPEVVDGDEEIDMDETVTVGPEIGLLHVEEQTATKESSQDLLSKPPSPKPQLSMSLQPLEPSVEEHAGALDMTLNPFEGTTLDEVVDVGEKLNAEDMMDLDMSALAPDASDFVAGLDEILGGSMIDQAGDPFAPPGDGIGIDHTS